MTLATRSIRRILKFFGWDTPSKPKRSKEWSETGPHGFCRRWSKATTFEGGEFDVPIARADWEGCRGCAILVDRLVLIIGQLREGCRWR